MPVPRAASRRHARHHHTPGVRRHRPRRLSIGGRVRPEHSPASVVVATRLAGLRHPLATARRLFPAAFNSSRYSEALGPRSVARAMVWSLGSLLEMEEALLQLLIERDPVPAAVLSWIVTGTWPAEAMQPQFDVSVLGENGPHLF